MTNKEFVNTFKISNILEGFLLTTLKILLFIFIYVYKIYIQFCFFD